MSHELDPGLTRVVIEIPDQYVDELMANLGDFAVGHTFITRVSDVLSPGAVSGVRPEKLSFNPELVTEVYDSEAEQMVSIIADQNVRAYAAKVKGSPLSGTQWATATSNAAEHIEELEAHGKITGKYALWKPYLYKGLGIRASKARELAKRLKDGTIPKLFGLGAGNIQLFTQLCDELITLEKSEVTLVSPAE